MQLTDEEWEYIGPYLPIGEYGPYPALLRRQFEGVIWRFKTGGQWREIPQEFGAWSTVSNRFRQWRDAGVFEVLLEGLIAEAAKRGQVDLSLVSIASPPLGPTTTPPGYTWTRTCSLLWRRLCLRRPPVAPPERFRLAPLLSRVGDRSGQCRRGTVWSGPTPRSGDVSRASWEGGR
ncbi:transposase IS4 family protein [Streptomyces pristinaespiralis ATCC 25486]|uniref:Transposase IS4 family protein n=1 Tax=Streptomyces pristinaespiralis (strain ATCC 25486 / DSM 40338 / CBS 914.69 / JCM 4507 / KCC S-0507 / NBRC 13074 / NRRL 2958 / 5647) TaxID=457429 RepID=B5H842_STRE2|nr:transposase IS4 family protein [Streptomyces pristinaespiralis ATCC 25486]